MTSTHTRLSTLPVEVLHVIVNPLKAVDLGRLYLVGDMRLCYMLREQPAVTIFDRNHVAQFPSYHSVAVLNFAIKLRFLQILTLGYSDHDDDSTMDIPEWKIDVLPKTLTSLHLSYPVSAFALVTVPLRALKIPINNSAGSREHFEVTAKEELARLIGQPGFDPSLLLFNIGSTLPALKCLTVFGFGNSYLNSAHSTINASTWTIPFLQTLPKTLHTFGTCWITGHLITKYLPPSVMALEVSGHCWIPPVPAEYNLLLPRLCSLSQPIFNLDIDESAGVIQLVDITYLAAVITPTALKHFRALRTLRLGAFISNEMASALPSTLTHLDTWGWRTTAGLISLPRSLKVLHLRASDVLLSEQDIAKLPPDLETLSLPRINSYEPVVFSLLPQSLVKLTLYSSIVRDDYVHYLPRTLRYLRVSQLVLTGYYLKPSLERVTTKRLYESVKSCTNHFILDYSSQIIQLRYLPPSLTSIQPCLGISDIPLLSLPQGLDVLDSSFVLTDIQLKDLPRGLVHLTVDAKMLIHWKFMADLPRGLKTFQGGKIIVLEQDIENVFKSSYKNRNVESMSAASTTLNNLQYQSSKTQLIPEEAEKLRFQIPTTFQRLTESQLAPGASVLPHQWEVEWHPSFFQRIPEGTNTISINSKAIVPFPISTPQDWAQARFPTSSTDLSLYGCPPEVISALPESVERLFLMVGTRATARPGQLNRLTHLRNLKVLEIGDFNIYDLLTVQLPQSITKLHLFQTNLHFSQLEIFPYPTSLLHFAIYGSLISSKEWHITKEHLECLMHLPRNLKSLLIRDTGLNRSCIPYLPLSLESFINRKREMLAILRTAYARHPNLKLRSGRSTEDT